MKKDSTSFSLPDGMIRRFKSECSLRGVTMSTVVAAAVESWLAHPHKSGSSFSTEEKLSMLNGPSDKVHSEIPNREKGEPWAEEVGHLIEILEGPRLFATAIQSSLQAFARAVQLERNGSGAGAPDTGPVDRDAVVGGVLEKAQRAIAKSGRIAGKPKDGSPGTTKRAGGDR